MMPYVTCSCWFAFGAVVPTRVSIVGLRLGLRELSCKKSEGRHYRHSTINDIVHRALSSAQVPSWLVLHAPMVSVQTV